jgi:ABC-2 type transport system ATP-binding protein
VLVRRDFLESIIQLIQQEGRTVLFSTHLLHEVERVADQVVILDRGRLVRSGNIEEFKRSTGLSLEESFVDAVGAKERR